MKEAGDTTDPARLRIRKFNPGTLQSDAEVIEQFVVRLRELEIVLDVLRANTESPSCQHLLMVAPRGRGKTMLLARTAAELRTNDTLGRFLLPVRFMEENHEIFGIADFWLESLFHLAREIAPTHPELSGELRATHVELCGRWGERDLGLHARAAVLDAADRLGRKLVLMAENLQDLFANVDEDFGWQLRAVLQAEPQIVLVATATSRFGALDDAEEPFFELFRTVELGPLSTEESRCLWEVVSGDSKGAREIRPLQILTGGNPRLLSIVGGFSEHRSLRQLMHELVGLIDDHTEYFRGHLEVLPKGERRVYVAVLDLWRACSTSEIATRARMDVRVVSTLLGRLLDRGAVVARSAVGGKRRLYEAAEPLYSIYYKLRRERDEASVVSNLIQFMVAFYDSSVLSDMFVRLRSEANDSPAIHGGIDRALARRPSHDSDVRTQFVWDDLARTSEMVWSSRRAEAESAFQGKIEAAFRRRDFGQVIELVDRFVAEGWPGRSEAAEGHDQAYLAHLRAEAYLGMDEYGKVIAIGSETHHQFLSTRDTFILYRTMQVLSSRVAAHYALGEYTSVISCVEDLVGRIGDSEEREIQKNVAWALTLAAEAQERVGRPKRALAVAQNVLDRFGDSDAPELQVHVLEALLKRANILSAFDNDHKAALGIYDQVIDRCAGSPLTELESCIVATFLNRSLVQSELGDFDGELSSYEEIISRCSRRGPWDIRSTAGLACALKAMRLAVMGRSDEARVACDEIDRRLKSPSEEWEFWLAWTAGGARAVALMVAGDGAAAMDSFRSALAACPTANNTTARGMIRLVRNLIAAGAEERGLLDVLVGDEDKSQKFEPLVLALRMRMGESVRAAAEVMEVAADVRARIESNSVTGLPWDD